MNTDPTSLRSMVYASLFGALTAVGAYIIIPLPPVPITPWQRSNTISR